LKRHTAKRYIVKSEDAELLPRLMKEALCCGAWMVFLIAVAFIRAGDET
jgi:hypothetical protein